ncbi:nucleoside phosphatase family-domain-containing protein [Echria macrotheca]|uniref:Nucleoside phosphatase family-domain-containing protein n=1 Tax=Echria macrotheca TaxID=438768 RepID=A0AAJ0FCA2_9PEZI|nr:nucleoside phosphatase family-domain-containing protein [Echria macrotheca]
MGKKSRWGVILDAGSSGTRLHIYKWKDHKKAVHGASAEELHSLPKLVTDKKWTSKIKPGVSTFGENPKDVGPDHLRDLIKHALKIIPEDKIEDTPIFLMATAGMRLLPKVQQTGLTREICSYLRQNTRFSLPDCDLHIQVIQGETEGLYGWIAANYLLGGFDRPGDHQHGKGHHTYGFLDMGGASAQIAFAPNATEAEKHANDLKLLRLRTLDGSPAEYKVFTATWLGFGVNQARQAYIEKLKDIYHPSESDELPDPCLPKSLRTTLDGAEITAEDTKGLSLIGTGKFDECMKLTYPLLGKDKPCPDEPCLLNGQHVPALDFDVNHFIGVSEYWHTTHGVFGGKDDEAYDFATYQKRVKGFCSRDWNAIESGIESRDRTDVKYAMEACFKASWLLNVLHEGIGIPRIGIDNMPGLNSTGVSHGHSKGYLDPFQPVDKIDKVEVSWTLGKMVLYAAGQIPPKSGDDRHPVGFGSNVDGIPPDFQFAGSSWRAPGHHGNETDEWLPEDGVIGRAKTSSGSSFLLFLLLLVMIGFIFRKKDRRLRVYAKLNSCCRRGRRPGSPRKGAYRGISNLTSKLFGRPVLGSTSYERVMEEGDANQFELGDVDSSGDEYSDSSEGSRYGGSGNGARTSGLATPKVNNLNGFDPLSVPFGLSALDRSGLVVRSDSSARLVPHLQVAGRRSRAGSPTRLKSPMAPQFQET